MAVPPPPRATTREFFSFLWAIYRCVTANTKVIKIQPIFPKEAFGKKNPIAFRNICGPGGVLPYITYTGMCRPTGSWFWSSWFRTGYPFQRRFLERGIIFRTHESCSTPDDYEEAFIWCISRTNKEVSFLKKNRTISIYKLSTKECKKLAHF